MSNKAYLDSQEHAHQCAAHSEGQACCLEKPEVLSNLKVYVVVHNDWEGTFYGGSVWSTEELAAAEAKRTHDGIYPLCEMLSDRCEHGISYEEVTLDDPT